MTLPTLRPRTGRTNRAHDPTNTPRTETMPYRRMNPSEYTITRGDRTWWVNMDGRHQYESPPVTLQFGASQTIPIGCGARDRIAVYQDGDDASRAFILSGHPGRLYVALEVIDVDDERVADDMSTIVQDESVEELIGLDDIELIEELRERIDA